LASPLKDYGVDKLIEEARAALVASGRHQYLAWMRETGAAISK
jgi:hypothetical protein